MFVQTARGAPFGAPRSAEESGAYLPVLTYWMQSPWFLKVEPSARVAVCQPLFLHAFASAGTLIVTAAIRNAGWKPVQQPASSRNVPVPPAPPSQYWPPVDEFRYASLGCGAVPVVGRGASPTLRES